jgi:DNA-binding NarL/FixJ family response regulator
LAEHLPTALVEKRPRAFQIGVATEYLAREHIESTEQDRLSERSKLTPSIYVSSTRCGTTESLSKERSMNIVLIDDHPLFSTGFALAVSQARSGVHVRSASSLAEAVEVTETWGDVDLALVDFKLAGADGINTLIAYGTRFPTVTRVLISGQESAALMNQARAAGASGFISKSMSMPALLKALDALRAGQEYFELVAWHREEKGLGDATPRQLEVLRLVAIGLQNKQIAAELGIAIRTVKIHLSALFKLTETRNRTHLLVRARELGLLD